MQTCPLCHHVLTASSTTPTTCCSHKSHLTTPTNPFVSSPPPQTNPFLPSFQPHVSTATTCDHTSLATPHVSGHQFHFPTKASPLNPFAEPVHQPCELTCRIDCVTHGEHLDYLPPWSVVTSAATVGLSNSSYAMNLFKMAKYEASRLKVLEECTHLLERTGWYWKQYSWQQAVSLLERSSVGTFIIRDSSDPKHAFSLSVQTEKGPTSVRVRYEKTKFSLDCETGLRTSLPQFGCVIKLIEHYVGLNEQMRKHVWIDSEGKIYSPITLKQPFRSQVASLKHLCRLRMNRNCISTQYKPNLPHVLSKYLKEYPYIC